MDKAIREYMSKLGKKGGKSSSEKRLSGMSKEERSEYMKKVRAGKKINY